MKNSPCRNICGVVAACVALALFAGNAAAQEDQMLRSEGAPLSYTLKVPGVSVPQKDSLITRDLSNEASIKLGGGVSLSLTSSVYDPQTSVGSDALIDPLGRWPVNGPVVGMDLPPHMGAHLNPLANFNANYDDHLASSVGAKLSMDLGRGMSFNMNASTSRIPAAFDSPRGFTRGGSGTETWSTFGAGVTMDLGGGGSLTLSGSVSNVSGSRCLSAFSVCR
jgi:hypothetical protein